MSSLAPRGNRDSTSSGARESSSGRRGGRAGDRRAALAVAALVLSLEVIGAWAQEPGTFRERVALGLRLLRQGRAEEALRAYDEALALATVDPERAEALLGKALVLRSANRYAESLAVYQAATELPGATGYQTLQAWRGIARSALSLADEDLEIRANEYLSRDLAASEAERALALERLGALWLARGEDDKAVTCLRELLDEYPHQPGVAQARLQLVEHYAAEGQGEEVDKLLAAARDALSPEVEVLHVRAAEMAAEGGNLREALRILDDLLACRPYSAGGWQRAWEFHEEAGDAQAFLQQALDRARGDAQVAEGLLSIAEAMAARRDPGHLERALGLFEQLLAVAPADAVSRVGAAQTALEAGRLELADRWSRQALEARAEDSQAQAVRARVLVVLDRHDEAFELLKRSVGFDPADLRTAERLASLLQAGQLADRLPELAAQVRKATRQPSALALQLARYHYAKAQWPQAVEELVRSAEAGETSEGYAAMLLRAWVDEPTTRAAVLAALEERHGAGQLAAPLIAPYVYASLTEGRRERALATLAALPAAQQAGTALQVIQWLGLAGRADLARVLYEVVLTGSLDPVTEVQVALTVAQDLALAGRLSEAVRVLEAHRKPGMPDPLSRAYDLSLAKALLGLGDVGQAEVLASRLAEGPGAGEAADVALVLAECAFRRGDYEAARRLAETLLSALTMEEDMPQPPPPPILDGGPVVITIPSRRPPGLPVGFTGGETRGRALFLLAEIALRQDQRDVAEQAYQRVVKEAPASAAATEAVQRLMTLADLQRLEDDQRARFLAGLCALDRGESEDARQALAPWLGAYDDALSDDARLLFAEGLAAPQPEEAARAMEELGSTMPDSPVAPYALLRAAELRAPNAPAEALRLTAALLQQFPTSALVPLAARLQDDLQRQRSP